MLKMNNEQLPDVGVVNVGHDRAEQAVAMLDVRLAVKRGIDVVGALIFFGCFGFVYLFVWAGVLCTTGRPAIYRHERVGYGGEKFDCLKFRSMVPDSQAVLEKLLQSDPAAREEWNRTFKLKDDPRITKFGRFIRKTSLDELPQFWNVLRGDMSLVGPRPVVQRELEEFYGSAIRQYVSVRPGITGPWQVGGRSDLSYDERVALDTDYALNWTISRDFKLLWCTVAAVFLRRGSY